jgi:hypothetical protein
VKVVVGAVVVIVVLVPSAQSDLYNLHSPLDSHTLCKHPTGERVVEAIHAGSLYSAQPCEHTSADGTPTSVTIKSASEHPCEAKDVVEGVVVTVVCEAMVVVGVVVVVTVVVLRTQGAAALL